MKIKLIGGSKTLRPPPPPLFIVDFAGYWFRGGSVNVNGNLARPQIEVGEVGDCAR